MTQYALYMRAATRSTIQYLPVLLFSGLSFVLPIFSMRMKFQFFSATRSFLRKYQSILYISHHETAGENVFAYVLCARE